MEQVDVVVVGARCAGSPTATWLARNGLRVALLDRSEFPSDVPSTHVLQPSGVSILGRLGILDRLWAADAVALSRFTIVVGGTRIDADIDPADYGAPGLCVRRVTLDPLLVDAAADAGVDVRTGVRVTGLLRRDGRVVGVETDSGPLGASLVIGADGRRSTVASLVGAAEYGIAPSARMFVWGYFAGVDDRAGQLRLGRFGELAFLASPTDGGLFMAGVSPVLARKAEFLADRERGLRTGLREWRELDERVSGAELVGPVRVVSSWHGYFRQAAGPGWVLLGDAGQFKDPTPGQGISDSLRHGERLADVVSAGIGNPATLDGQLRRWWRWRDRDCRQMHWLAADLGSAGPVPMLREQMIADLGATERDTTRFLEMLNHDVPPSKVFTARRMMSTAVRVGREDRKAIPAVLREMGSLARDQVRHARLRRARRVPTPVRHPAVLDESRSETAGASAARS